jgi:hypothetical protein
MVIEPEPSSSAPDLNVHKQANQREISFEDVPGAGRNGHLFVLPIDGGPKQRFDDTSTHTYPDEHL